jgi:hypothetical protein
MKPAGRPGLALPDGEGGLDEPVEIGWPQAEAVIRAVPEVTAHAYDGLAILLQAARRLAEGRLERRCPRPSIDNLRA